MPEHMSWNLFQNEGYILIPWSTTVPAKALLFFWYLWPSSGKNLEKWHFQGICINATKKASFFPPNVIISTKEWLTWCDDAFGQQHMWSRACNQAQAPCMLACKWCWWRCYRWQIPIRTFLLGHWGIFNSWKETDNGYCDNDMGNLKMVIRDALILK